MRAQMAANMLGVNRLIELCRKYGRETILAVGRELQDYGERKLRTRLREIPDGIYEFTDYFESEAFAEPMKLSVRIEIVGDEINLHFTSPPQVRSGQNMIYTALLSSVYYAVKSIIDPTILPNAGLARPITVTAPLGTLLNCEHPAAVDSRIGACQRVVDLIHGALSTIVPHQVTAASNGACTSATFNGIRDDKSLWVYLETIGGGFGARYNKDGLDGVHVHMTNTSNLPVEALENEYPLTLLCYELVDGSGRRCGGQGDLLSGSLAVFWWWAISAGTSECALSPSIVACYAASRLIRECNSSAFKIKQRGMLASDILEQIQPS